MTLLAAFTSEVTLGNAITVALGLLTWGVSWGAYRTRQENSETKMQELSERVNRIDRTGGTVSELERLTLNAQVKDHEVRIRGLEHAVTRIDLIGKDVEYIRGRIERALREEVSI